jgi:hypothetical protein
VTGCCDEGYAASGSVTIGDMLINRINVKKITELLVKDCFPAALNLNFCLSLFAFITCSKNVVNLYFILNLSA